ncbi:MAG: hypothetical protein WAL84_10450 [Candidatus Dormiibacterota bacterium]
MAERRHTASVTDQDEGVRRITALCLRLLTDLARGGYGERPKLDYLTPNCAASVHRALAAIGGDGWYVETDYGEAVAGTADLDGSDGVVRVELLVDDRSMAREPGGPPIAIPPARWRLTLAMDAQCTGITAMRAETA